MADAEWVLRFMAFQDQTYLNFPTQKSLTLFLNRQMENNLPAINGDLDAAERNFKQATSVTLSVFGEKAFRKFVAGENAEHPDGKWETKRVLALADVQLWGMTRFEKGALIGRKDQIYEATLELLVDPVFDELITSNTSDNVRVERRFDMWKKMLEAVMVGSEQGPRIFPRSIKQELWEEGRGSALCEQQIELFDDAHVDHIDPYSKGGKTVKSNGQLTHRYCNIAEAPRPNRRL